MVSGPRPVCFGCKRLIEELGSFICDAFPDGIPEAIASGENDHSKPVQGDGGLLFLPKGEND